MKVFIVYTHDCGDDEFDSFVVVANSEEEVMSKFKKYEEHGTLSYVDSQGNIVEFYDDQGPIMVKEINPNDYHKDVIICSSYNKG